MPKPPLERAARALCSLKGLPENTKFEGRPMWESFLPEARAVLQAVWEPSDQMILAAQDTVTINHPADVWPAMVDAAIAEG